MARLFFYEDSELYCHHSYDSEPNPKDYCMHAHDRIELFCFLSGHAHYLVEGTEYPLHPGDLMLMDRAEAHKLLLLSSEPYERIVIQFSPSALDGIDPEGLLLQFLAHKSHGLHNHFYFEHCRDIFSNFDTAGSGAKIRLHMLIVLVNVLHQLSACYGEQAYDPATKQNLFAHQILQYVNEHLFESISLSSLSRTFFLSPSQFNRVFRSATGASVGTYIREKRLLVARERITSGESPSASSEICGFGDYSVFYRAYKAKFGHAPSVDFRKP